jgi:succinate dehydrogenase / fumarate reductase, flavoprotein subunit
MLANVTDVRHFDAIVVGGGLTGLRAALAANEAGAEVAIISKVHPLRSHSVSAQGGINASLGFNLSQGKDTWEAHAYDTVKGSDYLADQDAVAFMCQDAPRAVTEMESWGTTFSRDDEGRIAQRPFGGAGFPRTCYAADRTGHNLIHTLFEKTVQAGIEVLEERFVLSLAVEGNRCRGLAALDISSGEVEAYACKSLLLATGGYGRLFSRSTNAYINTGDGSALALNIGIPLRDMEFVQFHPTTLFGTSILISEAARGEGGALFNAKGERFMSRYAPKVMELAPRDIVARSIQKEIDEGRGFDGGYVNLDLRDLGPEKIKERLPGIRQIAIDFVGVDPITAPIPIQPGQHYSMGGVACDIDCQTAMAGLYAAGEAACISVHGANRLGGNSLLETLVFGKRVGVNMATHSSASRFDDSVPKAMANAEQRRLNEIRNEPDRTRVCELREKLKDTMFSDFGIFRDASRMKEGLTIVNGLAVRAEKIGVGDKGKEYNQALIGALEFQNMSSIALPVCMGALAREESRGSHYRTDYPVRNDSRFLKHTEIKKADGKLGLTFSEVHHDRWPLEERRY